MNVQIIGWSIILLLAGVLIWLILTRKPFTAELLEREEEEESVVEGSLEAEEME